MLFAAKDEIIKNMAFTLPFVKKVGDDPEKEHSTPLDVKKLEKESKKVEKKEAKEHNPKEVKKIENKEVEKPTNPHVATIVYKPSLSFLKIDKYVLITIISVVFCLSGLSFWLYVQFFMSP